jgi:hypothetical protein
VQVSDPLYIEFSEQIESYKARCREQKDNSVNELESLQAAITCVRSYLGCIDNEANCHCSGVIDELFTRLKRDATAAFDAENTNTFKSLRSDLTKLQAKRRRVENMERMWEAQMKLLHPPPEAAPSQL